MFFLTLSSPVRIDVESIKEQRRCAWSDCMGVPSMFAYHFFLYKALFTYSCVNISVDDILKMFSYFSQNIGFDIICKLSPIRRQFEWNVETNFIGKIRKEYHPLVACWSSENKIFIRVVYLAWCHWGISFMIYIKNGMLSVLTMYCHGKIRKCSEISLNNYFLQLLEKYP